jgi:hypothetical protein
MPANYENVNAVWPDDAPAPSPQEALAERNLAMQSCINPGKETTL